MAEETYPKKYQHLQNLSMKLYDQLPGPMKAFTQLHHQSLQDGVLPKKIKELMALSISITTHCDGCIAYHVHDALKAGATREEILETIGVSIMMGGGPGLIYACEALQAMDEFSKT